MDPAWGRVGCGLAEGAKISSMSIRWLTASFDTQRVVNSKALFFWQQITAAPSYGGGQPGVSRRCCPEMVTPGYRCRPLSATAQNSTQTGSPSSRPFRRSTRLKIGLLPYRRYHLPGYELLRDGLCGAASPVSPEIRAGL